MQDGGSQVSSTSREAPRRRLAVLNQRAQIELAIERLTRFATFERIYAGQLNEIGERLLRASTFTAYCDCRALGVGKRADQIIAARGAATPTAGRNRELEPA
ncbi:MAG: hypothetical protein FJ033_00955 [Chloroflexi bacterium]|nr:hypothetical protein [Chloroflexota bacterium]